MIVYLLAKSQASLFDAPVHVAGSVRKDGTVVAPHVRVQKVAMRPPTAVQHSLFGDAGAEPAKPARRSKLDVWIDKHGGERAVARILASMTDGQRDKLLDAMATLGGTTAADVAARFAGKADAPQERGETSDLFSQAPAPEPEKPAALPAFTSAAAALEWVKDRARALGMGQKEFTATDEYRRAYPRIKALADQERSEQAAAEQQAAREMGDKLRAAGLYVGDRVTVNVPGIAGSQGEQVGGSIFIMGGMPHVELDRAITVSRGGRLSETKRVKWQPSMQREAKEEAAPAPQEAPAAEMSWADKLAQAKAEVAKLSDQIRELRNGRTSEDGFSQEERERMFVLRNKLGNASRSVSHLAEKAAIERDKKPAAAGPREGERNADGLIFHNGRWHREQELAARRQMLEDFAASKPNDERVNGWHAEVEAINAALGNTATTAHLRDKPRAEPQAEPEDGTEAQRLVRVLLNEWRDNNLTLSSGAALGTFKRRIRAAAKRVPENDEKARMMLDTLQTRVWGPDYDPKVADLELAKPQEAQQADGGRAAPFGVSAGISKADRRAINARVVKAVTGETDDSQNRELLAQYSGNGGCGDSLNEFYTDPDIARAMWDVIDRLGYTSGTALEPSCGTGVFMHTATPGFRVTGVEMDGISNEVARRLHSDRHEVMPPSSLERFANSDGGRQFDVVIGNPPYGPRGSLAKDDKPKLKSAETYFIDTAIDKAKPGGIVALVVPASVLNNKNGRAFRERMLRKAEFLGAQRMPNTAFEASHTDVTADVIWLRKRPDDVAGALMTVDKEVLQKLGVWDPEFLSGTYFEGRGADNLFGKAGTAMRGFGEVYTVEGSMSGVPERIAQFEPHPVGATPSVADIISALGDDQTAVEKARGGAMVRPYADAKVGDTKTVDGVTYVLQGRPPRWHRVDEMMADEAVTSAKPLAEAIERVLAGDTSVDRAALKAGIEAWVGLHGIPVKNEKLLSAADRDKVLHRLIGAVGKDGALSDAAANREAARVTGSIEAAAATLSLERSDGTFTVADLAERSGKSIMEASELMHASTAYADAGGGRWTTMDQYLTGELWPKLDAARAILSRDDLPVHEREKLQFQARRLEETIGIRSLEDVEIDLTAGFIPVEYLSRWLNDVQRQQLEAHPDSDYYRGRKPVTVTFAGSVYRIEGGSPINESILLRYLNRTGVREDDEGTIERWNKEFREWVLSSDVRDDIEERYNRNFRGFVPQRWSKAPIDVPGLDTADGKRLPNDYHWDSLRWALHEGKGIIADDVGLGKTLRGLMLARLAKMQGKAKKPTFVVPKSVLANWVAEANTWFPGSRILVIGETYTKAKDGTLKSAPDTPEERNRKYHDLAQNDYDFVFVSQPAFNELDVSPDVKNSYLGDDFWVQRGDSLGNAGDKRIKRVREQFEQDASGRDSVKRTDAVYFNHLPIDMLLIDEAHAFKNLFAAKSRRGESPKFLGGQGKSNRAFDMGFKARWVREQQQGKGIYALTATPTKNSPLEIYSMLNYIAPEAFEKIGIRNSEAFIDRFCEFTNEKILGTNGAIEDALVTSGFKNLDELRGIMNRYIARRTAKDVGLKLPEAKVQTHMVDMTPEQSAVYGELRAALAEAGKKDATGDAHVFSIMDKMAKAALDLELLDPDAHKGKASPKYEAAAKQIAANAASGGQVVFCEAVDSHEKIAAALVRAGIPRERIGVMNAKVASSSAARQNLTDKFNDGRISVIIGNKVMEEGVNLQKRATDIHHLDTPWDPATLQQRNGRAVRQGNRAAAVNIHTYLARGSFDGYRYQSMSAKRDWMEMLWNGGDRVENLAREGGISRDDLMIAMSVDPEAERERLLNDKAAAMERYNAEMTSGAVVDFMRYQDLRRSYKAIKNPDTASARRLRDQLEKLKTNLSSNAHFKAKEALDAKTDVLLHPESGDMLAPNVGVEVDEKDGSKSRYVVVGVDPETRTVRMRTYADPKGGRTYVPLEKLRGGTRTFSVDLDAEAEEASRIFEEKQEAGLASIKTIKEIHRLPPKLAERHYDAIQRHLVEAAKGYKLDAGMYGVHMPMRNRETGEVEAMAGMDWREAAGKTHDFVLPREQDMQALRRAYKDAERTAKIDVDRQDVRKGSRQQRVVYRRKYRTSKAYEMPTSNPFWWALKDMMPSEEGSQKDSTTGGYTHYFEHKSSEAKAALDDELAREQMARIRRSKSATQVLDELAVLAHLPGPHTEDNYGAAKRTATYPREALKSAWARIAHLGQLHEKVRDVQPNMGASYRLKHESNVTFGGRDGHTLHAALAKMSMQSGHHDLAAAILHAGLKRGGMSEEQHREVADGFVHSLSGLPPEHGAKIADAVVRHAEAGRIIDAPVRGVVQSYNTYGATPPRTYRQQIQAMAGHYQQAATQQKGAAA